MGFIEVSTEIQNFTVRQADHSDPHDIGDDQGSVTNVVAVEVAALHNYYGSSLGKELPDIAAGDTVWAVVADYSSGTSFGRTGAEGCVLDVFDNPDEAAALAHEAEKVTGYSFEHNGQEYPAPWTGYFEQLQSLAVWEITVKRTYATLGQASPQGVEFKLGK